MERRLTLDDCLDGCRSGQGSDAAYLWLIGSGGKTTLATAMARRAVARGESCVLTTSTRILRPRPGDALGTVVLARHPERALRLVGRALSRDGLVTFGGACAGGKLLAPSLACIEALALGNADFVVVEADGARGLPLKLFRSWEPVLPARPFRLALVVGFHALGSTLGEATLYGHQGARPLGGVIGAGMLCELLAEPGGGLSRLAPQSWIFLCGVQGKDRPAAAAVAQWILQREPLVEAVIAVEHGEPEGPYVEWRRDE